MGVGSKDWDEDVLGPIRWDVSARISPEEREWADFMEEAGRVLKLYCEAQTVEERARYVVPREGVLERMKAFYAKNPIAHKTFPTVAETVISMRGERRFAYMMDTEIAAADEFHAYPMVQMDNMEARLDFDAATCHNDPSFGDLVNSDERKASTHYMRVIGTADDYYNFAYTDRRKYYCFRLVEAGSTEQVWGYAPLGDVLGEKVEGAVEALGRSGRKRFAATLKLRKEADFHLTRQFLIEDIISQDWYYDVDTLK